MKTRPPSGTHPTATWRSLGRQARLWRLFHAAWSVAQLACLGYIWACVAGGRRGVRLWASVGFLLVGGGALVMGRGNCPMGPIQARWGDPVPFFELVLPPRAARAAIPVLAAISLAAVGGLVVRPPGVVLHAGPRRSDAGTLTRVGAFRPLSRAGSG